jgi:hypothetical protein
MKSEKEIFMNAHEFIQIFPLRDKNDSYAQHFIRQSYLQPLATGGDECNKRDV